MVIAVEPQDDIRIYILQLLSPKQCKNFQIHAHSKKHIIWDVLSKIFFKNGQLFATHSITISTFSSSNGISDTKSIGPLMTTPLFSINSFWLHLSDIEVSYIEMEEIHIIMFIHPLKVPRLSNSPSFSLPRVFFEFWGAKLFSLWGSSGF